jgi:hypothetical protein
MLKHAKLIVTDYINQYEPIIGEYDADTYENCLTRG